MSEKTRDPVPADYATLAAAWLWSAYERWSEEAWESFPEMGLYDLEHVLAVMERMLPTDTLQQVESVYAMFAARASEVTDDE